MINTPRVFDSLYHTLLSESDWDLTACVDWLKDEMGQEADGFVDWMMQFYPEKVEEWVE